jgi:type IX secretion system PorP/SprF family membrane protein
MKRTVKQKIVVLFCFCASLVHAQDFHLSQYDAAALNFNPSMTGMFDGWYRIHGHYRTQWSSVINNPFQTFLLSYDMPVKQFAFGGQIMDYRAGTAGYNVFGFVASGAYDYVIDKLKRHHLAVGIQLGFIQKSINYSKLNWGNQYIYTPSGGGFDNSVPSLESGAATSIFLPDANVGLTYYYANEEARFNPFAGVATHHLSFPNESFYAKQSKLPLRHTIHAGCKIRINKRLQLLPKLLAMRQINDAQNTFTLLAHYYLTSYDAILMAGPTFRLSGAALKKTPTGVIERDAVIMEAAIKHGKFIYRVSYDINTSSLNAYSNGRGGLELSLTYIARRKKAAGAVNCPRL